MIRSATARFYLPLVPGQRRAAPQFLHFFFHDWTATCPASITPFSPSRSRRVPWAHGLKRPLNTRICGFFLLSSAWNVLYHAQRRHVLATAGPYAWIRHPQYVAFVLILLGFLLQWPTLLTLAMFPILLIMYGRLAVTEEAEMRAHGVTLPTFAGPDWQAIEQARTHKTAQLSQVNKSTPTDKCSTKPLVLPLDHGPRAQTTPYLNDQRRKRWEAEQQACNAAAAKGTSQWHAVADSA